MAIFRLYMGFKWTLRDMLWLMAVIALLLTLATKTPSWKRAFAERLAIPVVGAGEVAIYPLDQGVTHSSNIMVVGTDVNIIVEYHRIKGVSAPPYSQDTVVKSMRVDSGVHGITWWRTETSEASELHCVVNGKDLSASLARAKSSPRSSSRSGSGRSYAADDMNSVMQVREHQSPDNVERLELVLRCLKSAP